MNKDFNEIGYIIEQKSYREYDVMVTFFGSQSGIKRFILRGYNKPTSKLKSLGLEYSKVRYYYDNSKSGLKTLRTGELLDSYHQLRSDWGWYLKVGLASELLIKFYSRDDHLKWFKQYEAVLLDNDSLPLIKYLVVIINVMGIAPVIDGCVICGDSRINGFSIEQGGYLCMEHAISKMEYDELLLIKALIGENFTYIKRINYNNAINFLLDYIEYHLDVKLNSRKLWNDV